MRILIGNGMMRVTKLDVNKKYNKRQKNIVRINTVKLEMKKKNVKVRVKECTACKFCTAEYIIKNKVVI